MVRNSVSFMWTVGSCSSEARADASCEPHRFIDNLIRCYQFSGFLLHYRFSNYPMGVASVGCTVYTFIILSVKKIPERSDADDPVKVASPSCGCSQRRTNLCRASVEHNLICNTTKTLPDDSPEELYLSWSHYNYK